MQRKWVHILSVFIVLVVFASSTVIGYGTEVQESNGQIVYSEGIEGGRVYFDKTTGTITKADKTITKAKLPEQIEGVTVEYIGVAAFSQCKNLKEVSIPSGIVEVGSSAFSGCSSLEEVFFSDHTEGDVFINFSSYCFENCSSLREMNFPSNTGFIHNDDVLQGCESLTSITLTDGHPDYYTQDGVLFERVNGEYIQLKQYPVGNERTVYEIPDNVKTIGQKSFYKSRHLKEIVMPDSVTDFVGSLCFADCVNLEKITLSENITSIGDSAFRNCGKLKEISLPEGVSRIGFDSFEECDSLEEINFPDALTYIGIGSFAGCDNLKTVNLSGKVTEVDASSFVGCISLTDINVAETNPNYSSLDGVLFNKSQTELLTYPAGSGRESYRIPDSVTWIYYDAFHKCVNLKVVTIPGPYAEKMDPYDMEDFFFSLDLTDVVMEENEKYSTQDGVVFNKEKTKLYLYPRANSRTIYQVPEGITSIDGDTFSSCRYLERVVLPDSVQSIGEWAFYKCPNLKEVVIPESVTEINIDAFEKCDNMKIVGYRGSYAESFALQYGIPFKAISEPEEPTTPQTPQLPAAKKAPVITAKNYTKTYGNKAFSLKAKVNSGGKLAYKSSDTSVASVSSSGRVTIKGPGKTIITITAAATDEYRDAHKFVTITVKPKKVAGLKVRKGKKRMTATWKRDAKATGYHITYARNKTFKKGKKHIVISKNKTTKRIIKKLKSRKTYYVKVRAYKKVGKTKLYGDYSKVKRVKIR